MNPTTGLDAYPVEMASVFNKTVELKPICKGGTTNSSGAQGVAQVAYWNVTNDNINPKPDDGDGITIYLILDNYSKSLSMFTSVDESSHHRL